jgi:hypothetical protein
MSYIITRPTSEAVEKFNYLEESANHDEYLSRIEEMWDIGWDVVGGGPTNDGGNFVDLSGDDGNVYRFRFGEFRKRRDIESEGLRHEGPVQLQHPAEFLLLMPIASTISHRSGDPEFDGRYKHSLSVPYDTPHGLKVIEYFLLTDTIGLYPEDSKLQLYTEGKGSFFADRNGFTFYTASEDDYFGFRRNDAGEVEVVRTRFGKVAGEWGSGHRRDKYQFEFEDLVVEILGKVNNNQARARCKELLLQYHPDAKLEF